VRDEIVAGLALEAGDLSLRSPRATRDSAQSAVCRVFENTTLGMSFIGAAYSLVDVGQKAAMSW
jgi:hypothetical protein